MAKERIPEDTRLTIDKHIKLYREDFEHLLQILDRHKITYKIISGNYNFDTIDELEQEYGKNPKDILIRDDQNWKCRINFPNSGSPYYSVSGLDNSREVFLEIKEFFLSKDNKFLNFTVRPWTSIIFVNIVFLMFSINEDLFSLLAWRSTIIFAIFWWIYGFYFDVFGKWSISLYKKKESSFFQRNKEEIIKISLSAFLGSALTLLGQYFLKN